jgi:hypothetical protein
MAKELDIVTYPKTGKSFECDIVKVVSHGLRRTFIEPETNRPFCALINASAGIDCEHSNLSLLFWEGDRLNGLQIVGNERLTDNRTGVGDDDL